MGPWKQEQQKERVDEIDMRVPSWCSYGWGWVGINTFSRPQWSQCKIELWKTGCKNLKFSFLRKVKRKTGKNLLLPKSSWCGETWRTGWHEHGLDLKGWSFQEGPQTGCWIQLTPERRQQLAEELTAWATTLPVAWQEVRSESGSSYWGLMEVIRCRCLSRWRCDD